MSKEKKKSSDGNLGVRFNKQIEVSDVILGFVKFVIPDKDRDGNDTYTATVIVPDDKEHEGTIFVLNKTIDIALKEAFNLKRDEYEKNNSIFLRHSSQFPSEYLSKFVDGDYYHFSTRGEKVKIKGKDFESKEKKAEFREKQPELVDRKGKNILETITDDRVLSRSRGNLVLKISAYIGEFKKPILTNRAIGYQLLVPNESAYENTITWKVYDDPANETMHI